MVLKAGCAQNPSCARPIKRGNSKIFGGVAFLLALVSVWWWVGWSVCFNVIDREVTLPMILSEHLLLSKFAQQDLYSAGVTATCDGTRCEKGCGEGGVFRVPEVVNSGLGG